MGQHGSNYDEMYGDMSMVAMEAKEPEILFTCPRCQEHYNVEHLEQPVTECPVCFYKPTNK